MDRNCNQSIKPRNVDVEWFAIPRASIQATKNVASTWGFGSNLCAVECNEKERETPASAYPDIQNICLRGLARAAAGPSGCTNEHIRVPRDEEATVVLLGHAADSLAGATVPQDVADALRLGRMVALTKPTVGVRGLIMPRRPDVGTTVRGTVSGGMRAISICA